MTYRGYNLTWQGRRLQALSGNNISASYTYNEEGLRTSKTVNNVVTNFAYNGSLLMAQTSGNTKLLFSYDAAGDVVSVNYNGSEYYYLRNAGNDVVALMDNTGQTVVQYMYDSWGKLTSTSGTLASSLGQANPFRYRGYYYDTETSLYYLQSRYYDPEVGRFISADVLMSTGQGIIGNNMFAYCLNNPILMNDSKGTYTGVEETLGTLVSLVQAALIVCAVAIVAYLTVDLIVNKENSTAVKVGDEIVNGIKQAVSSIVVKLEKAIQKNYKKPYEDHHIVPQNAKIAENTRKRMESVGVKVSGNENIVTIKTGLHRRLHKKVYMVGICVLVDAAFYTGRSDYEKARNINKVLGYTKSILISASNRSLF